MKTLILLLIFVVSGTAFAQYQDEPIPFDDEIPPEPLPRHQRAESDDFSEVVRKEDTQFKTLAREDDPTTGLSFDLHGGVLWLAESKKSSTARFSLGARLTWEWSRTFLYHEFWRRAFFVDLTWNITQAKTGSELVYAKVTHNYLVLAPALAVPLGQSAFSFFVQGGIGLFLLNSTLTIDYSPKPVKASNKGMFLLGQYGLGMRARISPDPQKAFFVVFRTEITGYIHRYTHDIMLSAGVGLGF